MSRPTERELERRLADLESQVEGSKTSEPIELTDEQKSQIEAMIDSLPEEKQAALQSAADEIEAEPDDAETDEFGLTDGERAYIDVFTGGYPEE